jgi:hypothetical protein
MCMDICLLTCIHAHSNICIHMYIQSNFICLYNITNTSNIYWWKKKNNTPNSEPFKVNFDLMNYNGTDTRLTKYLWKICKRGWHLWILRLNKFKDLSFNWLLVLRVPYTPYWYCRSLDYLGVALLSACGSHVGDFNTSYVKIVAISLSHFTNTHVSSCAKMQSISEISG